MKKIFSSMFILIIFWPALVLGSTATLSVPAGPMAYDDGKLYLGASADAASDATAAVKEQSLASIELSRSKGAWTLPSTANVTALAPAAGVTINGQALTESETNPLNGKAITTMAIVTAAGGTKVPAVVIMVDDGPGATPKIYLVTSTSDGNALLTLKKAGDVVTPIDIKLEVSGSLPDSVSSIVDGASYIFASAFGQVMVNSTTQNIVGVVVLQVTDKGLIQCDPSDLSTDGAAASVNLKFNEANSFATVSNASFEDSATADLWWDSVLERLYIALKGIKAGATNGSTAVALGVGKITPASGDQKATFAIEPALTPVTEGADHGVWVRYETGTNSRSIVDLHKVRTMHTTTGKAYVIVNGAVRYDGTGSDTGAWVFAFPLDGNGKISDEAAKEADFSRTRKMSIEKHESNSYVVGNSPQYFTSLKEEDELVEIVPADFGAGENSAPVTPSGPTIIGGQALDFQTDSLYAKGSKINAGSVLASGSRIGEGTTIHAGTVFGQNTKFSGVFEVPAKSVLKNVTFGAETVFVIKYTGDTTVDSYKRGTKIWAGKNNDCRLSDVTFSSGTMFCRDLFDKDLSPLTGKISDVAKEEDKEGDAQTAVQESVTKPGDPTSGPYEPGGGGVRISKTGSGDKFETADKFTEDAFIILEAGTVVKDSTVFVTKTFGMSTRFINRGSTEKTIKLKGYSGKTERDGTLEIKIPANGVINLQKREWTYTTTNKKGTTRKHKVSVGTNNFVFKGCVDEAGIDQETWTIPEGIAVVPASSKNSRLFITVCPNGLKVPSTCEIRVIYKQIDDSGVKKESFGYIQLGQKASVFKAPYFVGGVELAEGETYDPGSGVLSFTIYGKNIDMTKDGASITLGADVTTGGDIIVGDGGITLVKDLTVGEGGLKVTSGSRINGFVVVGSEALPAERTRALPLGGTTIADMIVVGDTVYVALNEERAAGTLSADAGIFASTALFGTDGAICDWTPWRHVAGTVDAVKGVHFDSKTNRFWYLTTDTGLSSGTFTKVKTTEWDTGAASTDLATVLSASFAGDWGVLGLFDFDDETVGFKQPAHVPSDWPWFSMMVATGYNKVALIQTGKYSYSTTDVAAQTEDTRKFDPVISFDSSGENKNVFVIDCAGLGPIVSADLTRVSDVVAEDGAHTAQNQYLFVAGLGGVAVLTKDGATAPDYGFKDLKELSATSFPTGYTFKLLKNSDESSMFTDVRKIVIVSVGTGNIKWLYVLTGAGLYRINTDNIDYTTGKLKTGKEFEIVATVSGSMYKENVSTTETSGFSEGCQFFDMVVNGVTSSSKTNSLILATSDGVYCSRFIPDVEYKGEPPTVNTDHTKTVEWTKIAGIGKALRFDFVSACKGGSYVSQTTGEYYLDGMLYVLSVDTNYLNIHRLLCYNSGAPELLTEKDSQSYFVKLGDVKSQEASGLTDFYALTKHFGTHFTLSLGEVSGTDLSLTLNDFHFATVVQNSANGALCVPWQKGLAVNQ